MKRVVLSFILLIVPIISFADDGLHRTVEILRPKEPLNTYCASEIFANALRNTAASISEDASTETVKDWIYDVFQSPAALVEVLSCPEILAADQYDNISFLPIKYTFPGGREIVVNYETQPHVLHQRLLLATKQEMPTDEVSPLVDPNDPHATWTNTNPAWYGIMVTQAGALDEFVGPDKNNVVSMDYINDNITKLYPNGDGGTCTDRTGIANDKRMINRVMSKKTAYHEGDTNDYYVAGDLDLRWISAAEMAFDIVTTVATGGGFALLNGAAKSARVEKVMKALSKNVKALTKMDNVKAFIRAQSHVAQMQKRANLVEDLQKSLKNVNKLEDALKDIPKGTQKYLDVEKEVAAAKADRLKILKKFGPDEAKELEKITNADDVETFTKLKNKYDDAAEIAKKEMANMSSDPHVKQFQEQMDAMKEVYAYSKELNALRENKKVTGSVVARSWTKAKNIGKSWKSAHTGAKTLDKAAKVAREGEKALLQVDKLNKIVRDIEKTEKTIAKLSKDAAKNAEKITEYGKQVRKLYGQYLDEASKMFRTYGVKSTSELFAKNPDELAKLFREEFKNLPKSELDDFIKTLKDVHANMGNLDTQAKNIAQMEKDLARLTKDSPEYAKLAGDLEKARNLHAGEITKMLNAGKKLSGAIGKLSRIKTNLKTAFRHGTRASTIRDYLFHSSRRFASRIATVGESLAFLHFVLGILGDFWDWTDVSTGKFTNDISMKPYLLLSADDIDGQDNVVNYGMWLMWTGDSTNPEDDDAAYLQATDFAEKFYNDLQETQEEKNNYACNVDIYVVRPIIRNPDSPSASLYWLIMNDMPWRVAR